MKVEPVSTLHNFLGMISQSQESQTKESRSFTGLLFQAVLTRPKQAPPANYAHDQSAKRALAKPDAPTSSSETQLLFGTISGSKLQTLPKQATPSPASAVLAMPQVVKTHPLAIPKSDAPVASRASAPSSSTKTSASSSSPPTEMFPTSGTRTHSGYMSALLADLTRNEKTGEVELHLTPMTTINEMEWLHLLRKAPMPSLLGQIQRKAEALGISLEDTPLTLVDTDLPPPYAGKSLEELNSLVVPTGFYYSNPNGYYGSIGGQLPIDTSQRSNAFAMMEPYVIELPMCV